ncbi:ABC transporter ATP-binding protein [Gordonia caeni]|uniref:ABC transporter ATP-binding protein n=1 Tax=Gordonia caeni TaxID=1007097 RepID=A0ABP7PFX2_9ACTN
MTAPPSAAPMLSVEEMSVGYGRRTVLADVDLRVASGSITAVLGPSGCGKTTLLRAVAGLEPITAGVIAIAGRTVSGAGRHVPPERRDVGLVPQEGALFPHLTVRRNIGFGLRGRAGRRERVDELIDLVGLHDLADRRPGSLSGGQRQRVALARALAPAPALIGLDEPFSALDSGLRTRLRAEVGVLLRSSGATVLLVTHDPAEALALADQVVVLLDGRVHQVGAPEELYTAPADFRVGELFGELNRLTLDGEVHFLRPHELTLARTGIDGLPGSVAAVEFRGSHHLVSVAPTDGQPPVAVAIPATGEVPEPGTAVVVRAGRS